MIDLENRTGLPIQADPEGQRLILSDGLVPTT